MTPQETLELAGQMGFDVSPWSLVASFVFGVIGFYIYRAAKRALNQRALWTGVILMIYPLFLSGAVTMWMVGLALTAYAAYELRRP